MKASCNIITSHCFFFCFSKVLSSCNPNHIYCNINSCYLQVLPDGQQRALHYRYKLSPLDKVNVFRPKELDPNATRLGIRGAMLGAYWCKKFEKLPLSNWLKVVWEASLNFKTPVCFYQTLPLDPTSLVTSSTLASQPLQVTVGDEAPAVITPLKPKLYILGCLTVEPGQAVKIQRKLLDLGS